jgi:hypothetical protein
MIGRLVFAIAPIWSGRKIGRGDPHPSDRRAKHFDVAFTSVTSTRALATDVSQNSKL